TITLAKEPKEEDIMNFPPPNMDEKILNRKLMTNLLYTSAIMAIGTIGMFLYGYSDNNLIRAQTMAFVTLAMFQVFNALNCRSNDRSIFKIKIWSNRSFIVGFAISVLLLILVIITPMFQLILGTAALSIIDWVIIIIVSSAILLADEIRKVIENRNKI
ncbi:MAG: cation transporting ATPase C-terminal domain-containing protein, partial [Candidatus Thorarchaeota archaeon]